MASDKDQDRPLRLVFEPYDVDVHLGLDEQKKAELMPELARIVHATFIDHPEFDQQVLPAYLDCAVCSVIRTEDRIIGFVFANLLTVEEKPVLHLAGAYVLPLHQTHRLCQHRMVDVFLALAEERFGADEFFVVVRTPNPRAIASFWEMPCFKMYPRPDAPLADPELKSLARRFCRLTYGQAVYDEEASVVRKTYPVPPWNGRVPWHRRESVNRFCRSGLDASGRDALFLIGRTTPPLPKLVGGRLMGRAG